MSLIIFILAVLGCTNIIVNEFVFSWLRNWIDKIFPHSLLNKLINCEICTGFWVGLIIALLFPVFGIHWFLAGCIGSIANKIVGILVYTL